MKTICYLAIITLSSISISFAGRNLPDRHDKNEIPSELEERQNEEVNLTDMVDENKTPDVMEERTREEKWRKDYSDKQFDDPEYIKNRGE